MIKRTYYLKNSQLLDDLLGFIGDTVPCFIEREFIEMDHSKVTLQFREADAPYITKQIALVS